MLIHEVHHDFDYPPGRLFDIAADVERYPEYLPGYFAARITSQQDDTYCTDQVVGFEVFRKCFRTSTILQRPEWITVTSADRLFRKFELVWHFDPLPDKGCRVSLHLELELRTRLAQNLFRRSLARLVEPVMAAFAARAEQICGGESEKLHKAAMHLPGDPETSVSD